MNPTKQRAAALGLALLAGCLPFDAVQAIATISIVTTGPQTVSLGDTESITFNVVIDAGSVRSTEDVVVYHDVFFSYDPAVLTLTDWRWGDALGAADQELYSADYNEEHPALGKGIDPDAITGLTLGTVGAEISNGLGTYRPGSLEFWQSANVGASALQANQEDGATLFSLTFDIVTTKIAYSSVVLIDDRFYFDFEDDPIDPHSAFFDWKVGGSRAVDYPTVTNSFVEVAPVPAPLALLAGGLIALGAVRRRSAS